jgi:peptidoglycan/LPS O-acetylase OafA/YrhL
VRRPLCAVFAKLRWLCEGDVSTYKKYFPTLDGWRALAVIGVIIFHGRLGFFTEYGVGARIALRGCLGVPVFFAISGFLITSLLLEELARTGNISLRRFYIRRCFRILPAYYAALAGICAAGLFAGLAVNYGNLPSCLLFYRNYMPLGIDLAGGFYTAHFWSLAVEEHFYLMWPLLLVLLKPKRASQVALMLALVVFAWRQSFPTLFPGVSYLSRTDVSIDGLMWGCLAAIYLPEIKEFCSRLHFSQLWMPVGFVIVFAEALHLRALIALEVVLFPALILTTVLQPESILGRFLEWQPLRWIGSLSYSLYLWQMLFLPAPEMRAVGAFGQLQRWPWNIPAIFVCAIASRYLLEAPMMHFGQRLSNTVVREPALPAWLPQLRGHANVLAFASPKPSMGTGTEQVATFKSGTGPLV